MSENKHTVAVLPSQTTADVVRRQLEAADIVSDTVEADGSFRLQVAEEDFARAMQVLFPVPQAKNEVAGGAVWFCSQCGEQVQQDAELCWSCGKARSTGATAANKPVAVVNPTSPLLRSSHAAAPGGNTAGSSRSDQPEGGAPPDRRAPRRAPEPSAANNTFLMVMLALIVIAIAFIAWLATRGS